MTDNKFEWLNKWICDKKREAPCFAFTDSEERKTAYFILDNFVPKEEVKKELINLQKEILKNRKKIIDITKKKVKQKYKEFNITSKHFDDVFRKIKEVH